jgi:hypothetical protein
MFIFRRISEKDIYLEFITGNKVFDELNPDGTLKKYLEQDIIKGGYYYTYLLLELKENETNHELLSLLRYKYTSIEKYMEELIKCKVPDKDQSLIKKKISESKLKIIYLSRIGVVEFYQEMNVSQIIINFFEFLITRNKKNVLIYVKILENIKKVIGLSYRIICKNKDEKWGNYFLASRIIKFEPK